MDCGGEEAEKEGDDMHHEIHTMSKARRGVQVTSDGAVAM
jgi:hypothetical protein